MTSGTTRNAAAERICFFGQDYSIHDGRLLDDRGDAPAPMIAGLIGRYLAARRIAPRRESRDWCSFRELRGAGPLAVNFAANTHKTIALTFGGDLAALDQAAAAAAGVPAPGQGFDRRYRFEALPDIPLVLNYNAADRLFPAQAGLLFLQSAGDFLDIRDIFTLGTYLTGCLVGVAAKGK